MFNETTEQFESKLNSLFRIYSYAQQELDNATDRGVEYTSPNYYEELQDIARDAYLDWDDYARQGAK